MRRDVTIVGSGIIGISCALYLQQDGHKVTVFEALGPGEGCSKGNAGSISPDACSPMSRPDVLWRIPRWLAQRNGPTTIQWPYLPRLLPWLIRFISAGHPEKVEAQSKALRALLAPAHEAYAPLLQMSEATGLIRHTGYIFVYRKEETWQRSQYERALRRRRGVPMQELDAAALRELEPALGQSVRRGAYYPENAHCIDPHALVLKFAEQFLRNGGNLEHARVTDCQIGSRASPRIRTTNGDTETEILVVAAGAESRRLAALLGEPVPLEIQRGYHVTISSPTISVQRPIVLAEEKIIATPMHSGLRLAGTAEFSGPTAPPNWGRAHRLVPAAQNYLPGLTPDRLSLWMGHRPCLPDSLPVISKSKVSPNIIYAFGHGHLGLTAAAMTGRLVADFVADREPSINVAPFRIDRF